jgi:environmental stress-induced protein Ves
MSGTLSRARSATVKMSAHRLLTPADYRRMPWRNGAGRTTEIAAWPPGAALDAFDWRVSIADVAKDGPFSRYAGIDRTIVVIAGAGMHLYGDGDGVLLAPLAEPYAFRGDDAVGCTLVDGPVRVFNLLLRRGRGRGGVSPKGRPEGEHRSAKHEGSSFTLLRFEGARVPPARFRLCYAVTGAFECMLAGHPPLAIAADQTLLVEADGVPAAPLHLNPVTADAVALVTAIDVVA